MKLDTITGRNRTDEATRVRIEDVADDATREQLIAFALDAANETPESVFGSSVVRYEDVAVVALHTS